MADFAFRLATLLRIREATRDERRRALADERLAMDAIQLRLDQVQTERNRVLAAARQTAGPGEIAVNRWLNMHHYQNTLDAQRSQLQEKLADAAAEVEQRRNALLEADREVRTLEQLREAQKLRHRQEAHRQDIKRLDEATQLRIAVSGKS
jgi:flagellar protein FliJ